MDALEYNSEREHLTMPEYGRNVQKLIDHAKTIENPAMRQAFVEKVVALMLQMNPQNGNEEEYRDKLWNHVFHIADYELDVEPPSGKRPTAEEKKRRPEHIGYPPKEPKYRHYGTYVQNLIEQALEMGPGHKQDEFAKVIASYMKLAYKTWNKEHYVSDEVIKNDLKALSGGKLKVDEVVSLETKDSQSSSNNNNNNRRRSGGRRSNKGRRGRRK